MSSTVEFRLKSWNFPNYALESQKWASEVRVFQNFRLLSHKAYTRHAFSSVFLFQKRVEDLVEECYKALVDKQDIDPV